MIATEFQRLRFRGRAIYTTRLLRRLPDVWLSCDLQMASVNRKLIYAIFNSLQIYSSGSLRSSLVLLPDTENRGIAVGISLLSCKLRYALYHFYFRLTPPSLIFDIHRYRTVLQFVSPCCPTPKTWVSPLEFRSYVVYKLRYRYFRFEGRHFGCHTSG